MGALRFGEQLLAGHAQVDAALDLVARLAPHVGGDDGPGVLLGLEQAGHELHLVAVDRRRGLLEPHVHLEPAGQHVGVVVPPARGVGLSDELHECLTFGRIGHAVQGEQIHDVAFLEAHATELEAADLRA